MEMANFDNLDANTLLAAFSSGYTTVQVQFVNDRLSDGNENPSGKLYTYKVPTAWGVQKGDWLVVLPGSAYKNVYVQNVDAAPQDFEKDVKWAVTKIDGTFYFNMKAQEDQLKTAVKALRRKRELEMLVAELQKTVGGDGINTLMSGFQTLLGVQPNATAAQALPHLQEQAQQAAQAAAQPVVGQQPANTQQPQAAQFTQAQPATAQAQQPAAQQGTPVGNVAKPSWAQ